MDTSSDVGLYGLSVMGRNLALNFLDRGLALSVFDQGPGADAWSRGLPSEGQLRCESTEAAFVAGLQRPRRVILAPPAGDAVAGTIARLGALLEPGDLVVDAGDSPWRDCALAAELCAARGIQYVGTGACGGPEGARSGLSVAADGDEAAWRAVEPLLSAVAARRSDGSPCAAHVGPAGSARFVQMAHNAIAGADAELVAETYHLLRASLRLSHDEMRTVFSEWNRSELSGAMISMTADVLGVRDEDGEALVEKVLDSARQERTSRWAAEAALELGTPAALLADAVLWRDLSRLKDERVGASAVLGGPKTAATGERQAMIEELRKALLAARVIAYAEGFLLLRQASVRYGWNLDLGIVARTWREGCYVSSSLLDQVAEAYKRDEGLACLLIDSRIKSVLDGALPSLRRTAARSIEQGLPVPAMVSAVSFFDGYRSTWLPASLVEAIRDRAASTGYERVDRPRGESFHSDWR